MFRTILTLSYTVPGIYLFLRIWKLFIPENHRWSYVFIFALVFSIYPLSRLLDDRAPFAAFILENISDYLLPFFLYLFLLILLTDIILIINRITGLISKGDINRVIYSYRYLGLMITLSTSIVIAGIINFNTIRTTLYQLKISPRKSELNKLRVAFVSDFHLERNVSIRFLEKYVRKINEIEPDILFYGGDIVEGSGNNIPDFEDRLRSIKTRFGIYGVLGNHDRINNFRDNFFTNSGIVLLHDSVVIINNSFVVAGRNDSRNSRKGADELVNGKADLPTIMLDHRPTDFNKISATHTDIVFSGHTHKGQLFPINLYLKNIYELIYGHLQKGNTHFIVSSGIRLWGPKVRTTGKSEIVVVDIEFEHLK